mmetsp:Transcript_34146/g.63299  ORF Transcript_34146/g.63299 Transcript_34146/m.63299 type:complete len:586 (-) Transcript_34146:583-2340(-)
MLRLALRSEVFQIGVLPQDLLKLKSVSILDLVRKLTQQQGNATFLKYSSWLKYARNVFNCGEHAARLYFETFLMVHRTTYRKKGSAKPMLSVDYGEFLVFLFLQKFHRHAATEGKNQEMDFFTKNIYTILLLLRDPVHHLAEAKFPSHPTMRRHEFTRLTFLVLASTGESATTELESFATLAPFWATKPNAEVPIETLCQWTLKHFHEPIDVAKSITSQPSRNIHKTVRVVGKGAECVIVEGAQLAGGDLVIENCKKTSVYILGIARFVLVSGCEDCTINLGVCRKMVTFRSCTGLTVSAVSRRTHLSSMSNSTFYLFCWNRPVFIGSNYGIKLAPYNTYYPNLDRDLKAANLDPLVPNRWSSAISFSIMSDKEAATQRRGRSREAGKGRTDEESEGGMDVEGSEGSSKKRNRESLAIKVDGADSDSGVVVVKHLGQKPEWIAPLPKEEFFNTSFPFDLKGDTSCNPFQLPESYSNASDAQRQRIHEVRTVIEKAELDESQQKALHAFVHEKFIKWMEETKRLQHLLNVTSTGGKISPLMRSISLAGSKKEGAENIPQNKTIMLNRGKDSKDVVTGMVTEPSLAS